MIEKGTNERSEVSRSEGRRLHHIGYEEGRKDVINQMIESFEKRNINSVGFESVINEAMVDYLKAFAKEKGITL